MTDDTPREDPPPAPCDCPLDTDDCTDPAHAAIPRGANAEDCPHCGTDLPYPWICPGHTAEEVAANTAARTDIPPPVELPRLVDALNDDVYSKIRARLAYLEDWRVRQQHENGKLLGRLDEYEQALNWQTTCLSCSRVLTFSYEETARAEKAEAELATIRRVAAEVLDTGHDRDMGHLMEALAEAGVNLAALDGDTPKETA